MQTWLFIEVEKGEDLEALTLEDVRRAAGAWLERAPMVSRALPESR